FQDVIKMAILPVLLLLTLSIAQPVSSQELMGPDQGAVPRGCGWGIVRPYTLLCDLDSIWGVAVESVAAGGVLASILLTLVLLCRLRHISEGEKRSGVGPILLLLLGVIGLFGLSFAYLIEQDESLCLLRRALWGVLFALCFSCLLVQGVRLRRLGRERRSPGGCALTGLALGLSAVQGIIAAEWLLLTVLREGRAACQYLPLDFSLACSYVLALLLAALTAASLALCGKTRQWRCNAIWLLVTCMLSLLLWVAWVGFYLYGNDWLGRSPDWNDPTLAIALVAQGWLLLLFHAIPESHLCLRPPPQPTAPDYFDTSQNSTRMRETSFDDEIPLSHRQFVENQGYGYTDENAAEYRTNNYNGLRSGSSAGQHNSSGGARPSAPFRSNVYQPTEMTMILNGGAVPSAPPTYTGRQLW
uniref:G-protein coupled receptors family 3 profile domain-containing protein n=1 Tax=Periophthalmus magnuspinnatus TaxID=409849 RepID=A0A3B3ZC43_9GOBI